MKTKEGALLTTEKLKRTAMKESIYPCLWFDGQARAAADFYCSIFKNSKVTSDNKLVVNFELNGKKVMGLNGGPQFKLNQSISFFVTCQSEGETNEVWGKLLKRGKILMPIDKYPWSERYGWLQDKFGMTWQISLANKGDKKHQITPALLFTGKNFGRAEQAINLYCTIFKSFSITTLSLYPDQEYGPGKVLYSEFKLADNDLIIMDGPGNHAFTFNEALSFVVDCKAQDDIDYFWTKLTAHGGKESQCGWLSDMFGVSWQIVPANIGELVGDLQKSPKVMEAILKMKKIEIKTLQAAYSQR
jgi:predicted 3-demethylubiquinone-9 3-methyltransferase (glyoxalase superfamily)